MNISILYHISIAYVYINGSMQIYPNEVLKDLSHGSQLGITGLPVSFAEHLFSSVFD